MNKYSFRVIGDFVRPINKEDNVDKVDNVDKEMGVDKGIEVLRQSRQCRQGDGS